MSVSGCEYLYQACKRIIIAMNMKVLIKNIDGAKQLEYTKNNKCADNNSNKHHDNNNDNDN